MKESIFHFRARITIPCLKLSNKFIASYTFFKRFLLLFIPLLNNVFHRVKTDSPACYAIGLYLLQKYAKFPFVLTAKADDTESQTGTLWFVQLEKNIQNYIDRLS